METQPSVGSIAITRNGGIMAETTRWTGKLIDANGRVGRLEMNLPGVGEGGEGEFTVELQERDGHPLVLKGRVSFGAEGSSIRFRSSGGADQKESVQWDATLTRAEAARYAKEAMLGTYGAAGGTAAPALTKGVVILWQFA
jgi:hypothetical protein